MQWMIVGTGQISAEFVKTLRFKEQEVAGVVSRKIEQARQFSEEHKIHHFFTHDESIEVPYDAVYIGTPNITHFELALKYLNLGKHVMVEKIFTDTLTRARELFSLAESKGLKLMEAYKHITRPKFYKKVWNIKELRGYMMQKSRHVVNGTVETASSFREDMFGGALPDLGVYPISLAVLILGKVRTFELKNVVIYNGVEAELEITLHHENGGLSEFKISKLSGGPHTLFADGMQVKDDLHFEEEFPMQHEIEIFTNPDLDPFYYKPITLEVVKVVENMKKELAFMKT